MLPTSPMSFFSWVWVEVLIAHPNSSRQVRVDQSQFGREHLLPALQPLLRENHTSKNLDQLLFVMPYEMLHKSTLRIYAHENTWDLKILCRLCWSFSPRPRWKFMWHLKQLNLSPTQTQPIIPHPRTHTRAQWKFSTIFDSFLCEVKRKIFTPTPTHAYSCSMKMISFNNFLIRLTSQRNGRYWL